MQGYNVRKTAQVVAFFAIKEGGEINVLKLAKLLYLADRRFLDLYDYPILFDKLVSMRHGPVNSLTLDYINGEAAGADWDAFIAGRANYNVGLKNKTLTFEKLDELNDAEIEVLEETYRKFGGMDQYALVKFTHNPGNCPEWEDPDGSSATIPYARVFKYLGKKESAMLAQAIEEERFLRGALDPR